MKKFLARLWTPTFFAGIAAGVLLTSGAGAALLGSAVFSDVKSGAFYDQAVGELNAAGIIQGYEDGKFHPNDYVTRGQLAVLFKRLRDDINGTNYVPPTPPASTSSSTAPADSSSSSSRSRRSSSSSSSSRSSSSATTANATYGSFRLTASTFNIPDVAPSLSLSVLRDGGTKGEVTVAYDLGGGTAVSGTDYTPSHGTLTFKDGEKTKNVTGKLIRNNAATGHRTLVLTLSSPTGGATLISPSTATITLVKTGVPLGSSSSSSTSGGSSSSSSTTAASKVAFNAAMFGVLENAGSATITVQRTGTVSGSATVEYTTVNGSAFEGTEYTRATGTLSFGANETTKTFTVPVNNNSSPEGNKQFSVQLKNPSGAALGHLATVPVTIIDDESATTGSGSIRMDNAKFYAQNGDGYAYVVISRAGGWTNIATVSYDCMDSTAQNGVDYTRVSGSVTFAAGELKKEIAIPLLTHTGNDGEKEFSFRITNVTGNSSIGNQMDAKVVIQG